MPENTYVNPYMTPTEKADWHGGTFTQIGAYTIKPKRDFPPGGFRDAATRTNINMGWVITKGGAHAVPGAGWFNTRDEARAGLHLLIASKGDADVYHALSAAMRLTAENVIANQERALKAHLAKGLDG